MRSLQEFLQENPLNIPSIPRVRGLCSSARCYQVVSALSQLQTPQMVVVSNRRELEVWKDDLESLLPNQVFTFPGESHKAYEHKESSFGHTEDRMAFRMALAEKRVGVYLVQRDHLLEKWRPWSEIEEKQLSIAANEEVDPESLAESLIEMGFREESLVENPGEFSLRGEILDLYGLFMENPVRLEFFGDEIESIRTFDLFSQRSIAEQKNLKIHSLFEWCFSKKEWENGFTAMSKFGFDGDREKDRRLLESSGKGIEWQMPFFTNLSSSLAKEASSFSWWAVSKESLLENCQGLYSARSALYSPEDVCVAKPDKLWNDFSTLPKGLVDAVDFTDIAFDGQEHFYESKEQERSGGGSEEVDAFSENNTMDLYIICHSVGQGNRLKHLLEDVEYKEILIGGLHSGFTMPSLGWALFTDHQLFNRLSRKKPNIRKGGGVSIPDFEALQKGDFVLHRDYGIGRFVGITRIKTPGGMEDCVLLEYSGKDKLSIPVAHLYKLERYTNQDKDKVNLHKLGGKSWDTTKAKAKKSAVVIAKDLVELYAKRQLQKGYSYPADGSLQKEFEQSFVYDPTPDQVRAVADCTRDLESGKPMDRLICGDVGFGKTEVAMRAAFKVVCAQKQVCVLVPTTVLASQHFENFVERFSSWPVRVELLNRYKSAKEKKKVLDDLEKGNVDVVVGTHTLLSERSKFKELGLVIIDEEQKFGVKQKEKLLALKLDVDTLAMSATPIPRTLHLSLMGVRDISLITTPPRNRLPVETRVTEFQNKELGDAVRHELERGGQVFVVNNHIKGLEELREKVMEWVPNARVAVAHGQMNDKDLEQVMSAFVHREFDVLICTTIIEAGIDIPSVNTILIHNAHQFGVSQLYQLRGRVGRADVGAYAYLITPPGKKLALDSQKRLHALASHTDLGSGYQLAMRDLEIRGAGNLLGTQQSGFILEVGYETYLRMVRQAVQELKGDQTDVVEIETKLDLGEDHFIPESYVEDSLQRISLYQRLSRIANLNKLDQLKDELLDRYGKMPNTVENLIAAMGIRYCASRMGIALVEKRPDRFILHFSDKMEVDPKKMSELLDRADLPMRFLYNTPLQIVVESKQIKMLRFFTFFRNLLEES